MPVARTAFEHVRIFSDNYRASPRCHSDMPGEVTLFVIREYCGFRPDLLGMMLCWNRENPVLEEERLEWFVVHNKWIL